MPVFPVSLLAQGSKWLMFRQPIMQTIWWSDFEKNMNKKQNVKQIKTNIKFWMMHRCLHFQKQLKYKLQALTCTIWVCWGTFLHFYLYTTLNNCIEKYGNVNLCWVQTKLWEKWTFQNVLKCNIYSWQPLFTKRKLHSCWFIFIS